MTQKKITPGPEHLQNIANAFNQYLIPALQKTPKPQESKQSSKQGA